MVYAPFGSVPASRLALSWSGRQRHGGEKASKECTTGAPNESRFFFCSSRPAPLLGVRYDRICPSLPFFGSGDVTGDDEHRFRLDPGEAISRYAPGLFQIWRPVAEKKKGKSCFSELFLNCHTPVSSPSAMVGRTLPAGGGTATISAHYVTAACDKKSLPTTVHVRPSNINCNSLRADFSLTKYNPTVLLGWVVHATPLRPCC